MEGRVTSVFLYVKDVRRSLEFYNEVVGAEVVQIHAESEGAPLSLAILRIGGFTIMLHPQEPHADEFTDTRVGVGIHLQIQVDDVDVRGRMVGLPVGANLHASCALHEHMWRNASESR